MDLEDAIGRKDGLYWKIKGLFYFKFKLLYLHLFSLLSLKYYEDFNLRSGQVVKLAKRSFILQFYLFFYV